MRASLEKLAALNGDSRVFCAHEYTLANLQFALRVEPQNQALQLAMKSCAGKKTTRRTHGSNNHCRGAHLQSFFALAQRRNTAGADG